MVKGEDWLLWIVNGRRSDRFEPRREEVSGLSQVGVIGNLLGNNRTCIVVAHDMFWANHNIVSSTDCLSLRQVDSILLDDLLNVGLWQLLAFGGKRGKPSGRHSKPPPSWYSMHPRT